MTKNWRKNKTERCRCCKLKTKSKIGLSILFRVSHLLVATMQTLHTYASTHKPQSQYESPRKMKWKLERRTKRSMREKVLRTKKIRIYEQNQCGTSCYIIFFFSYAILNPEEKWRHQIHIMMFCFIFVCHLLWPDVCETLFVISILFSRPTLVGQVCGRNTCVPCSLVPWNMQKQGKRICSPRHPNRLAKSELANTNSVVR